MGNPLVLCADIQHLHLAEHRQMADEAIETRAHIDVTLWLRLIDPARHQKILVKIGTQTPAGIRPFPEHRIPRPPCEIIPLDAQKCLSIPEISPETSKRLTTTAHVHPEHTEPIRNG